VSITDRLKKLEAQIGSGDACPECGWSPNPQPEDVRFILLPFPGYNADGTPREREPAPPPERCGTCGRLIPEFTLQLGPLKLDGDKEVKP
jgi:hypothetical protein